MNAPIIMEINRDERGGEIMKHPFNYFKQMNALAENMTSLSNLSEIVIIIV